MADQLIRIVRMLKILVGVTGGGFLGNSVSGTVLAIFWGALIGGIAGWAWNPRRIRI